MPEHSDYHANEVLPGDSTRATSRNAIVVAVDTAVRRAWPELRDQLQRGHPWPDAVLTDAIAEGVDAAMDEESRL